MHIAILQFEVHIDDAQSLKDKRRVVRSIKDGLHKHHMVSVAEVAALDTWNLAIMGLVACNRSGAYLQEVMDNIVSKLQSRTDCRLGECSLEIVGAETMMQDSVSEDGSPLWTPEERREADDQKAETGDEGDKAA
jgi:uncharacterized protein YlxP (DUF503 family)